MNRFSFILIVFFISCSSNKQITTILIQKNASNFKVVKIDLKNWCHKDILKDTIPGVSLERVYQELLKNKKGKEVIVAVLDMQMDINHEDLKDAIWVNKDEIPNNNIDDDNNGYIDDINGWNFIGNSDGNSVFRANFEYVRIVRDYKKVVNKNSNNVENNLKSKFDLANKKYLKGIKYYKKEKKNMVFSKNKIDTAKIELRKYLHNDSLSLKQIDTINTKNNKVLKESVKIIKYCIKHNLTDKIINETIAKDDRYLNLYLNLEYNDRELIGDNPNDIDDKFYGGNNIQINQEKLTNHATYVAGVLGVKRINNNIKIMPIVISPNGDEHDKDIALAIKYAVDNGANIINMSSGKEFSLHEGWVHEALKYAAKNNVLFITSGGNNAYNIDTNKIYPNDVDKNEKEIVNTFINVGASTYNLNKNLRASFSNFGSENIDLFAPGKDIYTTVVNNKYDYIDGTSVATPIVSRVAALILSYYPNLKAHQVKEILLASGVSYDIEVEITDEKGKKKLVPFSSLSKSGKIVNAYNALLYAKNYKKWKKGKWSKK